MQGIFLHIMADARGSVAVIISTLMTKYDGWSGWDPIASCIIAIMIFISAIPLVKSSGMKLLLALPNEVEYSCRDTLQGLGELRGVVRYAALRIWMDDKVSEGHGHHHHHHGNVHEHEHEQTQGATRLVGVIHVIATQTANLEDVRERARQYLKGRDMDVVVHVEKEGRGNCWCGGSASKAT